MTQDPDTPKFMGKPRPELDEACHNLPGGKSRRAPNVIMGHHDYHCLRR
jgi:hypothetical protein